MQQFKTIRPTERNCTHSSINVQGGMTAITPPSLFLLQRAKTLTPTLGPSPDPQESRLARSRPTEEGPSNPFLQGSVQEHSEPAHNMAEAPSRYRSNLFRTNSGNAVPLLAPPFWCSSLGFLLSRSLANSLLSGMTNSNEKSHPEITPFSRRLWGYLRGPCSFFGGKWVLSPGWRDFGSGILGRRVLGESCFIKILLEVGFNNLNE